MVKKQDDRSVKEEVAFNKPYIENAENNTDDAFDGDRNILSNLKNPSKKGLNRISLKT